MSVVSISMPEALLERIDEFADEHGYSGRSEVVREGARALLEEFQGRAADGQTHTCTVTVVFEYCQHAVQQRLTGVRHEYDGIVSATTHAHVRDRYCMELYVLEGTAETLSGFVNRVRAVPDVRAVDYAIITFEEGRVDQHIES
ncbi:CopG family ribbon-helix-helix protein [Haloferax sp. ATB1]|uniref:CopG family ribbon-helix-helix protein n=1 Tax=Haloferax sp. ATB1 TaxID=1508454 RepID=UPI0005B1D245|nr:CopG family ribbon-helix-helix protein [Haloferax sp. ATB1]